MKRSGSVLSFALRWLIAALGVSIFAPSAFAQSLPPTSAAWAETVANAKKEGRVNYYSVIPPAQNDALVAAFNKEYPDIRVVVVRGAGELTARIAAEQKSGADGADVFSFADTGWFTRGADGLLPVEGPNAADYPKEGWVVPGAAAQLSYSPLGFLIWNTQRLPQGLKTWNDLLAPSLQGKIGTREGMTSTLAGFLDFLEKEVGEKHLVDFGQQKPRFYPSTVPLTQAVASGEIWAANSGNIATLVELVKQGAPIAYAFPKLSYANPQAAAVLKAAKRPNAARVFLDFAMSPKGQAALNGGNLGASARPGIAGTLELTGFKILDPEKYTPVVREQWQARFEKLWRNK